MRHLVKIFSLLNFNLVYAASGNEISRLTSEPLVWKSGMRMSVSKAPHGNSRSNSIDSSYTNLDCSISPLTSSDGDSCDLSSVLNSAQNSPKKHVHFNLPQFDDTKPMGSQQMPHQMQNGYLMPVRFFYDASIIWVWHNVEGRETKYFVKRKSGNKDLVELVGSKNGVYFKKHKEYPDHFYLLDKSGNNYGLFMRVNRIYKNGIRYQLPV